MIPRASLILLLIVSGVSCSGQPRTLGQDRSANGSSDTTSSERLVQNPQSPLLVELTILEAHSFRRNEAITVRVEIKNASNAPVLACIEDWNLQTGLITFVVTDQDGDVMQPTEQIHLDFSVDEKTHLDLLMPGEHKTGEMNLIENKSYDFGKGSYFVVARYYCPFDGDREVEGREVQIAGQPQFSLPVEIRTDY